jgi:hypothetical protein
MPRASSSTERCHYTGIRKIIIQVACLEVPLMNLQLLLKRRQLCDKQLQMVFFIGRQAEQVLASEFGVLKVTMHMVRPCAT